MFFLYLPCSTCRQDRSSLIRSFLHPWVLPCLDLLVCRLQ
jgi:hypothetical protein